ncbi:MAG: hypothetical protein ACFCUW_09890 [Kiloniellaceae bacterium]
MRPIEVLSACAVSVLATVFTVQQGEHGPLVVYKLEVPKASAPAVVAPPPISALPVPQAGTVVPSRAPKVLGTVVMPASALPPPRIRPVSLPPPPARSAEGSYGILPLPATTLSATTLSAPTLSAPTLSEVVPAAAPTFHVVENGRPSGEVGGQDDTAITLEQINSDIAWRRETTDMLRQLPFSPRF